CRGCDHASPHIDRTFASVREFENDIPQLAPVLHVGEFKFVGGEPLLHPHLLEFLSIARQSRIADRIAVITNGTLLHRAPPQMWELIDVVWISLYPGVNTRFDESAIRDVANRNHVEIWWKRTPEFLLTLVNDEVTDPELRRRIFVGCRKRKR